MADKETYPSIAFMAVNESAANTLTFKKLEIANPLVMGAKKLGLILHRIEYAGALPGLTDMFSLMNSTLDGLRFGLSVTDNITALSYALAEVLDLKTVMRTDFGAAASGFVHVEPLVSDFTTLPGGGLLVPADRLYIWCHGGGLSGASYVAARVYYTARELTPDEYWQLVESRHLLTT